MISERLRNFESSKLDFYHEVVDGPHELVPLEEQPRGENVGDSGHLRLQRSGIQRELFALGQDDADPDVVVDAVADAEDFLDEEAVRATVQPMEHQRDPMVVELGGLVSGSKAQAHV